MAGRHAIAAGSAAALMALASAAGADAARPAPEPSAPLTVEQLVPQTSSAAPGFLTGPVTRPQIALAIDPNAFNARGFACTGSSGTFVVPTGIGSVAVVAHGGDGGSGQYGVSSHSSDGGAAGVTAGGILTVPGEALTAKVGCLGGDAPSGVSTGGVGGWGYAFGGNGGNGVSNPLGGGGGGGATGLLRGSTVLTVAAGGGGAGSGGLSEGAGGNAGRSGHNVAIAPVTIGGKAATATTAGLGGPPGGGASPGHRGGLGGSVAGANGAIGGGGGGGGLLGGGGGGSGNLGTAFAAGGAGGRNLKPLGGLAINPDPLNRSSGDNGSLETIWLKPARGGPSWPGLDIARGVAVHPSSGGYVLDDFGGIYPFHQSNLPAPAAAIGGPYWPGFDIARGIAVMPDGTGGFVLDGFGGIHGFKIGAGGVVPAANGGPYWPGVDIARGIALDRNGQIGAVIDGFGGIHLFGINGNSPGVIPAGYPIPYHAGQDTVRGVTLSSGSGGVEVDRNGTVIPWGLNALTGGGAPAAAFANPFGGLPKARGIAVYGSGFPGGYIVGADGKLYRFSPLPLG